MAIGRRLGVAQNSALKQWLASDGIAINDEQFAGHAIAAALRGKISGQDVINKFAWVWCERAFPGDRVPHAVEVFLRAQMRDGRTWRHRASALRILVPARSLTVGDIAWIRTCLLSRSDVARQQAIEICRRRAQYSKAPGERRRIGNLLRECKPILRARVKKKWERELQEQAFQVAGVLEGS